MSVEGGAISGNTGGGDMFDFWREQLGGAQANDAANLRAVAANAEKTGGGAPVVDEANTRATEENNRIIREQTAALRENTAATRAAVRPVDTGGETGL